MPLFVTSMVYFNALGKLVLEGRDDGDRIVATKERTRKTDKRIVEVVCVSGQRNDHTSRPHIHIRQPQVRCPHMVQGDISQHVNGVRLWTVSKVSDNRESTWDGNIPNNLLVDLGSFAVEEKGDTERSDRDYRKKGVPIPTLQPKGQKVHSLIAVH